MSSRKFKIGDSVKLNSKASKRDREKNVMGSVGKVTHYLGSWYNKPYQVKFPGESKEVRFDSDVLDKVKVPNLTTKERLEQAIKEKEQKISDINSDIRTLKEKLVYLAETGQDSFDENEFKAYRILTMIDEKKLNKFEQAKEIAKLVKN